MVARTEYESEKLNKKMDKTYLMICSVYRNCIDASPEFQMSMAYSACSKPVSNLRPDCGSGRDGLMVRSLNTGSQG